MKTNSQIVRQAAEITFSHKILWLLGIFLSSGFNLHAWYGWQWLTQNPFYSDLQLWFFNLSVNRSWSVVVLITLTAIVVINFLKLVFFGYIHNQLHDLHSPECLLCIKLKEQTVWQVVKTNHTLVAKTILVSLFTIASTIGVISLFHFYTIHTEFNFLKAFLLMGSLIIMLVGISWWNLLTVLFMMWHEQSLAKAAGLAIDLLMACLRRIGALTTFSTVLFFISIVAGGLVLFQIPNFLASSPNFLFTAEVFMSWQVLVSVVSGALFIAWVVINNVWFNIVMAIMFNELVRSQKSVESSTVQLFANQTQPSPLHHLVDRNL